MPTTQRASIYDRLRPHLNAADLIRRLGLDEVRTAGSESYLRPLCHESTSGESLHVNLHTGRWMCRACETLGMFGDLFQLVEYAKTGGRAPSRGNAQGSSAGHREAIVWLCDQFGIPFDEHRMSGDDGLDVVHLFSMAAHEYLLGNAEVLAWIQDRWGFDRATVEAYGIGFMPSPMLPAIVAESHQPQSRAAFKSAGLGWYQSDGTWHTRFEGRVLFPYLEHGRAVYLIGRATPWTPALDDGRQPPKYHKLAVHSEQRPYISERVTNDHLYNEPVMATADELGVVEGVADAVAISALGISVVSPVTISFNATDLERFIRKCRENKIARVWILFDNELSGSGNWAARRTGLKLVEGGLTVKIITLPLGPEQQAARDEVLAILGDETFGELERCGPRERKVLISEAVPDEARREWLAQQVAASKIDAAEWCALEGAAAPGRFNTLARDGRDVIDLELEDVAQGMDPDTPAVERADRFTRIVDLVAHVEERLSREEYAGMISRAAGKGVSKSEIAKRIAGSRRANVAPKRQDAKQKEKVDKAEVEKNMVLLPPEPAHVQPAAPPPPSPSDSTAPAPPAPSKPQAENDHAHYAPARDAVAQAVEAKVAEESIGEYVMQTILRSMGYTPFRTPDELYLVRGSERIPVGIGNLTPKFVTLLWRASGLTPKKSTHRAYIAAAVYFLERDAERVVDVSWSHVAENGAVYFPTGDAAGRILKIEPGQITRTKMAETKVPAVAGNEFAPFEYLQPPTDGTPDGIARTLEVFRWTSIPAGDRLVLIHWLACLPILRRVGTVPIVRIEGGSSSGKTRTVDAVSILVNGRKSSSVPTAAALISRLAVEMLTVDDNREAGDVSPDFLGTMLQATHLGAREKRKTNSDTGTVIERVSGALLMNGIEPIHDGRSELASRMLTLRCSESCRVPDSPTAEAELMRAILATRDAFWSEAVRRCAIALELDKTHGDRIGTEIEGIFGTTRIGRLSVYLRLMYLVWLAGQDARAQSFGLDAVADEWREAFSDIAEGALESLLAEELAVQALRYVFAHGRMVAEPIHTGSSERRAFEGKFVMDTDRGDAYLGPVRASQLARLARTAGRELNAPRSVAINLRAGQLERRVLDGIAFLQAAGFAVDVETTRKGKIRYTFRQNETPPVLPSDPNAPGDTWLAP